MYALNIPIEMLHFSFKSIFKLDTKVKWKGTAWRMMKRQSFALLQSNHKLSHNISFHLFKMLILTLLISYV